ncbi:hypothetical protein SAMN05216282_11016 [Cryobacterium psychrotolerans]|uniref:Uncharacterized protein n=1 Tax=Cryobacterium psychrotolerans TaxID=386301 RepID=A0A1G9DSE3_9MICO|nr:hypothetical protein [Cryobacterium psychrotolerans]TFD83389.1 hypothetical protein E3T56_12885 [Cryobacterium psychrotolerans]SDK66755.1 hypothetical protein SAMN05216282_11016 [Cryobacterium psychrotolerans]
MAVICGVAVMGASFLPWLGAARGETLSGWDIFVLQRDTGGGTLLVLDFFTDSDGRSYAFLTGLGALVGGLGIAVLTVVFVPWSVWLRGRHLTVARRRPVSLALITVVQTLLLAGAGAIVIVPTAYPFFAAADASGATLEFGLVVVWAAAIVGMGCSLSGVYTAWDTSKRPLVNVLVSPTFVAVGVAAAVYFLVIG